LGGRYSGRGVSYDWGGDLRAELTSKWKDAARIWDGIVGDLKARGLRLGYEDLYENDANILLMIRAYAEAYGQAAVLVAEAYGMASAGEEASKHEKA